LLVAFMTATTNLIEKFVATLNHNGLEPLFARDVPCELRAEELTEVPGMYRWEISAASDNAWVIPLESRLPYPFPTMYRYLISQFKFAEFEIGPIMFLANTGKDEVFNELSRVWANDPFPNELLRYGFLQFGRQAGGGYDPVCFAMKDRKRGDAPVVQLDHEEVLIRKRIRIQSEIAPSFSAFVQRVVAGEVRSRKRT
jgi:hypothetical protein